ncbi:hypothetical protein ACU686_16305 [Yinghuangia aomiensis]
MARSSDPGFDSGALGQPESLGDVADKNRVSPKAVVPAQQRPRGDDPVRTQRLRHTRANVEIAARSGQDSRGFGFARRSTATS